jgi:phospholipase/lecithinase/hemolysin
VSRAGETVSFLLDEPAYFLLFPDKVIDMEKRNILGLLPYVLILACLGNAHASLFSDVFIFGDSLSDTGNVSTLTAGSIPGVDYSNGRFSNGSVYADHLAQSLGFALSPLSVPVFNGWSPGGGNNFAYGGALTDGHRSGAPLGVNTQVASYINGIGSADPNALHILFSGANDVQRAIGIANDNQAEAQAAFSDPTVAQDAARLGAANIGGFIQDLAAVGARHFFVPNVPDWSLTPAVMEIEALNPADLTGYGAFAQEVTLAFNDQLVQELLALQTTLPGVDIVQFDFFSLWRDMISNPDAFGFIDVTTSCYDGDDLGFTGGGTACANPDQFFYWDRIHPTASAHSVFAQQFSSAIPEPTTLTLVGLGIAGIGFRRGAMRKRQEESSGVAK